MAQQPTDAQLSQGGVPDPLDFRRARPVGLNFKAGATLDGATTTTIILVIAGALLVRLHFKFTVAGTLSFEYRRSPPDSATAYTTPSPHADRAVVGGVDDYVDINPGGESLLAVTWTPGGALDSGVVFFDQMQQ